MTHARNTIRTAMVAQLVGLPLTASRVYASRVKPIQDTDLPAIVINTLSEENLAEQGTFQAGVRKQMRSLQIQIVIHSRNTSGENVMSQLDNIAEDVEDAIYADKTLAAGVKDIEYVGAEVEMEAESDVPRGEMTLTFQAMYRVSETAVGAIIG